MCSTPHRSLSASLTPIQPIQRTHLPGTRAVLVYNPPYLPFRARGTMRDPPAPGATCAARSTSQGACVQACACETLGCCMCSDGTGLLGLALALHARASVAHLPVCYRYFDCFDSFSAWYGMVVLQVVFDSLIFVRDLIV